MLTDLDREESYCFTVQVHIPSRGINKQYGEPSQVQCSELGETSIFNGKLLTEVQYVAKHLVSVNYSANLFNGVEGIFITLLSCSREIILRKFSSHFLKAGIVV